jgi:TetR/AcrR family transcriptional repressor of nem operon
MNKEIGTRERLLSATLELIWERSYHSVGVGAICEKAGVKKGSFYHFFKSKAELAAVAIETYWEDYQQELNRIFSSEKPPLERLSDYFAELIRAENKQVQEFGRVRGCPFLVIGAESANLEIHLLETITRILEAYSGYFTTVVHEAHAAGLLGVDNPDAAARWLFSFFEGTLTHAYIQDDLSLLQDLKPGCMQLLAVRS